MSKGAKADKKDKKVKNEKGQVKPERSTKPSEQPPRKASGGTAYGEAKKKFVAEPLSCKSNSFFVASFHLCSVVVLLSPIWIGQIPTHCCRSIQGANVATSAWPCLWSKACGKTLLSGRPFWIRWPLQKSRGGGTISKFRVVAWAFEKIATVVLRFFQRCFSVMVPDTSQDVG